MSRFAIDYSGIVASLMTDDLEERVEQLREMLPDEWLRSYDEMTPTQINVYQFSDGAFEFLFDLSSELVPVGIVPGDEAVEDRVVAAFGRSQTRCAPRDRSRMAGFIGPSTVVFGEGYDKGHFLGHALGGQLDANLFPQRTDINRGWSEPGKVFRRMERYCADSPGTFCFSRPIYADRSWLPAEVEYGLLRRDGTLWVERFPN